MNCQFNPINLIIITLLACSYSVNACTDFKLVANDGTVLITRSMEFAQDLQSNLRTSTQGRDFSMVAPDGKPGLRWVAKYGYVYLDGLGVDMASDGMNEVGLSFEALYFPGYAKYQTITADKDSIALPYLRVGDWALSNFATVAEVKAAITNVAVVEQKIPGQGDVILPFHYSFFDKTGAGLVVEYVDGQLNIYDNNVGVFTNAPAFDWHVTNLNNYVNLKPSNPKPVVVNGITFVATGQGAGMLGLPGDISPPSRFVKTSVLVAVSMPAVDKTSIVNLAEHIINNVDIPFGLAREPGSGNYTSEYTQWVVFKDLTNKMFYYRNYENLGLKSVDMSKLDLTKNGRLLSMPIAGTPSATDKTTEFMNTKVS